MARINWEDEIYADYRFRRLIRLVGDEDKAIGMLIRFWTAAQDLWVKDCLISEKAFNADGFGPILQADLAEMRPDGVYARGSEKHFGWYKHLVKVSSVGGKARASCKRDIKGKFKKESSQDPATIQPGSSHSPALFSPFSSLLSPSSIQKEKNIYILDSSPSKTVRHNLSTEEIATCVEEWGKTLAHFGVKKDPKLDEVQIARLVSQHGFLKCHMALQGARHEAKSDKYDPSQHISIRRLLKPDVFEKFVNLGAQQQQAKKESVKWMD